MNQEKYNIEEVKYYFFYYCYPALYVFSEKVRNSRFYDDMTKKMYQDPEIMIKNKLTKELR